MLSKLLFGVNNSPQRKICVVLAVVLVLMGVGVMVIQGREDGVSGVAIGLTFTLAGLVAIAILSRQFAARDEKVATQENLDRLDTDFNAAVLPEIVDQRVAADPMSAARRVTGQIDGSEIQAAVDSVRAKGIDTEG